MASRVPPRPLGLIAPRQKRERVKSQDHLAFIRTLPCLITGVTHLIEAAHVSFEDLSYGKFGRGYGQKEEDRWTVPLHRVQHARQHSMNEREFWRVVGIDPCRVALALWNCNQDHETALLIIQANREASQ